MAEKRYYQRFYSVTITLPVDAVTFQVAAGAQGTGSVPIQNFPFLIKRVSHGIVGPNGLYVAPPPIAPASYTQDGAYRFSFRTDQRNYMNEKLQAIAAFGGGQFSQPLDLVAPIELQPKETLTVDLTNDAVRNSPLTVQIIFAGVEPLIVGQ